MCSARRGPTSVPTTVLRVGRFSAIPPRRTASGGYWTGTRRGGRSLSPTPSSRRFSRQLEFSASSRQRRCSASTGRDVEGEDEMTTPVQIFVQVFTSGPAVALAILVTALIARSSAAIGRDQNTSVTAARIVLAAWYGVSHTIA